MNNKLPEKSEIEEPITTLALSPVLPSGASLIVPDSELNSLMRQMEFMYLADMLPQKFTQGKAKEKAIASVLTIALSGRELGLPPQASLRVFDWIGNQPALNVQGMLSLIKNKCKDSRFNFKKINDDKECIIEAKRYADEPFQEFRYSWADAEKEQLTRKDSWIKRPKKMLKARCLADIARSLFPDVIQGMYIEDEVEDFKPIQVETTNSRIINISPEEKKPEPMFSGSKPTIVKPAPAAIPETKKEEVKAETQIISQPNPDNNRLGNTSKPAEPVINPTEVEQEIEQINTHPPAKMEVQKEIAPAPEKKILVPETPKIQFAGNKPILAKKITTQAEAIKKEDPKPAVKRTQKIKASYTPADIEKAKEKPENQLDHPETQGSAVDDYYASLPKDTEGDIPYELMLRILKDHGIDNMNNITPIRMGILKQKEWKSNMDLLFGCLIKLNPKQLPEMENEWRSRMAEILEELSKVVGNEKDVKVIIQKLSDAKWTSPHCMWAIGYLRSRKIVA